MRKLVSFFLILIVLISTVSCDRIPFLPLKQENPALEPEAVQKEIIDHASLEYVAIADPDILRIDTWKQISKEEVFPPGLLIALIQFVIEYEYYVKIGQNCIEVHDYRDYRLENVRYYSIPKEVSDGMIEAIKIHFKEHPDDPYHFPNNWS